MDAMATFNVGSWAVGALGGCPLGGCALGDLLFGALQAANVASAVANTMAEPLREMPAKHQFEVCVMTKYIA